MIYTRVCDSIGSVAEQLTVVYRAVTSAFRSRPMLRRVCVAECSWNASRARAQRLATPVAQLTAAPFQESSPSPLKYALNLLGLMSPRVRLPLVEPTDLTKAEVASALALLCDGYLESMIGKFCGPVHKGAQAVVSWARASKKLALADLSASSGPHRRLPKQ